MESFHSIAAKVFFDNIHMEETMCDMAMKIRSGIFIIPDEYITCFASVILYRATCQDRECCNVSYVPGYNMNNPIVNSAVFYILKYLFSTNKVEINSGKIDDACKGEFWNTPIDEIFNIECPSCIEGYIYFPIKRIILSNEKAMEILTYVIS